MNYKKIQPLILSILFAVMIQGVPAHALRVATGAEGEAPHKVPQVTTKIKVDGQLEDPAWQKALVLELKYEVEPGENIKAPVKTQLMLVSTAGHLYVAFRAYDPDPSQIRANLTDRDNIANDDHVGIILDTFNDSRRAYGFLCNPYGIQADRITLSLGNDKYEWDAIWNSAARKNQNGYVVEMAIPYSSLRFQRKKEDQVWGIDAIRSYPRNLSHTLGLFPRDRNNNCYMCQATKLIGFREARPGKNIEFDPTLSAHLTQERKDFPDGKMTKKDSKVDPGLTARWSFTTNLTLQAAVNPDFSHVEADAAQLDINTSFALFYPEKRPFFLEGASLFLSPFYAVYTRTVKDPDWGIKLTGKEGKNAIGFYTVRDNSTHLLFPSSESTDWTTLRQPNQSTVVRYRRDIGAASTVGVTVTDREGDDYYNRLVAVDGDLKLAKRHRLVFQYLGSQTEYPDEVISTYDQPDGKLTGSAWGAIYQYATQNVYVSAQYVDITPDFRADAGFFGQTGARIADLGVSYIWRRNPGHWYTTLSVDGGYNYTDDRNGNMLEQGARAAVSYYGAKQSYVNISANYGKKSYYGVEMDNKNMSFVMRMRPSGALMLRLDGAFGDQVDYSNVQKAVRVKLNPILQYNIGKHLYLGLDHVYERLEVKGERLYTANLSNLRLKYQFNRRAFLRTILQYADYNYNTQQYGFALEPRFKHLFTQVLFSYKLNPQTVLFLGYSDDYYGYRYIPIKQNNRTFFLKVGYALVL